MHVWELVFGLYSNGDSIFAVSGPFEELDPESHQRPVENVQIIKDNWKQSTSMTYEIFVKNQKDKKKCFGK